MPPVLSDLDREADPGTELELAPLASSATPPPPGAAAAAAPAAKQETDLPASYLAYLSQLRSAWQDLPDLYITYHKLAYEVVVPVPAGAASDVPPNLVSASWAWLQSFNPFRPASERSAIFHPLHACSGVVKPGEMTLLLAPPGHGKSALLKSLAGRMFRDGGSFDGDIRWNGLTPAECAKAGLQLSKLCAFVEQGDVHFPMLTVRETFQFALDNSNADSALLRTPEFCAVQANKVELMLELLGLKECADTVVGDTFLRGVSGGQKKRVTLGEMMLGQARALFLDEISTGLDAAATFDIASALKKWTRTMRGSAMVALLQPAPDVFDMFDKLILLRHGHVVFNGTQAELRAHLAACNIVPNPDTDFADWIIQFLSDPTAVWKRDLQMRGQVSAMNSFRESFREEQKQMEQQQHNQQQGQEGQQAATAQGAGVGGVPKPLDFRHAPASGVASAVPGHGEHPSLEQSLVPDAHTVLFHLEPEEEDLEVDARSMAVIERANSEQADCNSLRMPVVVGPPAPSATPAPADAERDLPSPSTTPEVTVRSGLLSAVSTAPTASVTSNPGGGAPAPSSASAPRVKRLGRIVSSKHVPLSTAALKRHFERSAVHTDTLQEIAVINDTFRKRADDSASTPPPSDFTRAQLFQQQSRSLFHHTQTCLWRQFVFMKRSTTFVGPRLFQAVVMGLMAGSLFSGVGTGDEDYTPRMGLIVFSMIFISLINLSEIPLASQFKLVVYKQVDAGFYSTFSYVLSVVVCHLPLAFLEVFIYGTCVYWLAGFHAHVSSWLFFVLMLFSLNLYVSVTFRSIAYRMRNADVATNIAGPLTIVTALFAGFLITQNKIPNWLIWVYWLSPYSWGLRSAALNEFHSGRYPHPVDEFDRNAQGDVYLDAMELSKDDSFHGAGIAYLLGVFALFIGINGYLLSSQRFWLTTGTRRAHDETEYMDAECSQNGESVAAPHEIKVRIGEKVSRSHSYAPVNAFGGAHGVGGGGHSGGVTPDRAHASDVSGEGEQLTGDASGLAFTPSNLTFSDLRYVVTVTELDPSGVKRTYERALLTGINGFARAGELTALMGSSGAGKTTLMDVIAGRKTEGKITGKILVDGHPQTFPDFSRRAGYVEQSDIHVGLSTVREAIEFSAALRLPRTVTAEVRARFVDQILADLELTKLAGRQIGDEINSGLSPGELKRVTIGVELAANPTFLFLDEPTSGLDARAALIVLRVIRTIARRGRSVVCTIHQPSAELFGMFDRLLLLKSGGREVYFGPVGEEGVAVASYFMHANIESKYYRPQLPEQVNVASWMLDVIGAGTSAKGLIAEYGAVYAQSALREENMQLLSELMQPHAGSKPAKFDSVFATDLLTQYQYVLKRLFQIYWRDTQYGAAKFGILLFMSLVFGVVYFGIDDSDETGLISKIGCVYVSVGFTAVMHCSYTMPFVLRMRAVFYREKAASAYAAHVYSTCLGIVELPYVVALTLTFTIPMYFMIGFEYTAGAFFQFNLVIFLIGYYFSSLGQLFSSLSPNMQVSDIFCAMCLDIIHLFGGVLIQKAAMPIGWQWLYQANAMSKGIIAILLQQYRDASSMLFSVQQGNVELTQTQFIQNYLSSADGWQWYYVGWLLFMIIIVRVLIGLTIQFISHVKR